MPFLAANSSLLCLIIDGNIIGDAGCGALASAMATHCCLRHLVLSENLIGDEGWIALAAATRSIRWPPAR